ncbi:MAG: type 4a pilus biogenesis protein PilO [Gammaproteobacteria bacterium]|nr:type 4a pilus biogenesis protein PilO [Gammaproteobacteria bacterium]
MNLEDLNELDLSNIGDWPTPIKALLVLILCIGLGVGWYYWDTEEQLQALDTTKQKEPSLKKIFEDKQAKAVNLDQYKIQLKEMKESFGAMLRQLPDKTEVPELLIDVSQTGLGAGLEFSLFKPTGEVKKEFYAELPIQIVVNGNFHDFGTFISGLAALPRIVTIHDVKIAPADSKKEDLNGTLVMEAVAKTYRYLDEEEEEEAMEGQNE